MAVIVLASPVGAPGVTTTALALTEHWPGHCLLVDTGHQLSVEAGVFGGRVKPATNLLNIVEAARISEIKQVIWELAQPFELEGVPVPAGLTRRIMPGLPTGAAVPSLDGVWPTIAAGLRDLGGVGIDVIVDVGRVPPAGINPSLVDASDRILLMVDPTLSTLVRSAGAAAHLRHQLEQISAVRRGGVLCIRPAPSKRAAVPRHTDRQVAAALKLPVVGDLAWDPAGAAVYAHHAHPSTRRRSGGLVASSKHLAKQLHEQIHGRRVPDLSNLPA